MSDNKNTAHATAFIESLKESTFRKQVAPELRKVTKGDWEAVVKIAEAQGFSFTKQQLKDALPENFFKGHGKRPRRGWDVETLKK